MNKKTVLLMYLYWRRQQRKKLRRSWVNTIVTNRMIRGEYHHLVKELELDGERFQQYFRMSSDQLEEILAFIGPAISKRNTTFRPSIPPKERLAMTLRYLATGDSIMTIAFSYRVGVSTLANIIPDVCGAIWDICGPKFLSVPKTEDDWLAVADGFKTWNFPNCLGALDGKHIVIQAPPNTGSRYFNYKGTFSIVLLALVDAGYRFLVVDIGSYGRNSDGGIFASSAFGQALEGNKLHVPKDTALPGARDLGAMPYVIVADEAFPLKRYIMRPYPGRNLPENKKIFNYRLSRAKRIVENAFGILANRWRIFHRKGNINIQNGRKVVLAACVLHNYLMQGTEITNVDDPSGGIVDAPNVLQQINGVGNHPGTDAMEVRNKFCQYFNSPEGQVPWQFTTVRRGTVES